MQTISISEAYGRLPELCDAVAGYDEQIVLASESGDVVLISADEWNNYRETMRLLRDRAALKALVQSFEDHDAGKSRGKSVEEVFRNLT